jgi:hypothetical protein
MTLEWPTAAPEGAVKKEDVEETKDNIDFESRENESLAKINGMLKKITDASEMSPNELLDLEEALKHLRVLRFTRDEVKEGGELGKKYSKEYYETYMRKSH